MRMSVRDSTNGEVRCRGEREHGQKWQRGAKAAAEKVTDWGLTGSSSDGATLDCLSLGSGLTITSPQILSLARYGYTTHFCCKPCVTLAKFDMVRQVDRESLQHSDDLG